MSYIGNTKIGAMYLGETSIGKAYLGNDLVFQKGGAVLPYDSKIEYLETTGEQYIDLPFSASAGNFVEVSGEITPIATSGTNLSFFSGNPYNQFSSDWYSYNSNTGESVFSSTIGRSASNGALSFPLNSKSSFALSTLGKTINGTFTSLPRSITASITGFRIFANSHYSTGYPMRLHSFSITVGDSKILDLIPVRVGQVGYMYDKIGKVLYGNNGTGSFTLGADK